MLSHFLLFSTFRLCCSLLLGTDINQTPVPTDTPAPTGTFRPLIEVTATPTLQGTPNYECPEDPWLAYHDMIENNLTPGGSFNLSCQTCIQYALLTATARAYTPTPVTPGAPTFTPSPTPTITPTPAGHTYLAGPWEYHEVIEPGNGWPYSVFTHNLNMPIIPNYRMVGFLLKVSPSSIINSSYFSDSGGYRIGNMSSYHYPLEAGHNYCIGFNTGSWGTIGSEDDLDSWCPAGYEKTKGDKLTVETYGLLENTALQPYYYVGLSLREVSSIGYQSWFYGDLAVVYEDYNPNPQDMVCDFPELEDEEELTILPELSYGEEVCLTIQGLDLDFSGISWLTGWDNAHLVIPGWQVCAIPMHFGSLWLFGLIVNLDGLVSAITAFALIRWWVYS